MPFDSPLSGLRSLVQRREWVDGMALIEAATEQMAPGQLLIADNFTLYDAMAALEIMEPRMDSGMLLPAADRTLPKPWSIKYAQTVSSLTVDEILGIVDFLLLKMVSWITGSYLSQSLFTCVFLHDKDLVSSCKSQVLRAFLISTLKTVSRIKSIVELAQIVEDDEYFGFLPYGFSLAHEVTDAEASDELLEIENSLVRNAKEIRDKAKSNVSQMAKIETDGREKIVLNFPESCTSDQERLFFIDAVIARLRFHRVKKVGSSISRFSDGGAGMIGRDNDTSIFGKSVPLLNRLAVFLMEAFRENKKKQLPMVLAAYNEDAGTFLVLGVPILKRGEMRNPFGIAFIKAAQRTQTPFRSDTFDNSIAEIPKDDLLDFVEALQTLV
ncbi:N-alpha-acetyltransferase 35 NatC auxiliary subunit [Physocladia obscura]|uniref:N-alpha-acetyltransferase 35 NatC auxiliary subunit n=1 Tax=Physocladia obscura TaxID=109957 RepID=A0AAD5XFT8_9FUNG|nr:N-alpha-acetyltransferase 35 NatC auxiliary subunit [Physocladia obscura]